MSILTDCPSCSRKLRVPDELIGQKVKCPTCNEIFAVIDEPAVESAPAPAGAEPKVEDEQPASAQTDSKPESFPPPEETSASETGDESEAAGGRMACPYCGEQITRNAARCRFCGEDLGEEEGDDRPWEKEFRPYRGVRRDSEPHRGTLILTLGIVSIVVSFFWFISFIGLGLGIAAWVMGYRDMKKMRANRMDPQGLGTTQSGMICGIVGTSLGGLCSLGCMAYLGFVTLMVSASRTTPTRAPSPPPIRKPAPTPAPIPKRVPAKPGKGAAIGMRLPDYLPGVVPT